MIHIEYPAFPIYLMGVKKAKKDTAMRAKGQKNDRKMYYSQLCDLV